MQSTRFSRQILPKLELSRQIFKKIRKYHISWEFIQCKPSCSIRVDRQAGRQTDKHDKANSHFSQFSERSWTL